jgi:hypothetical protein
LMCRFRMSANLLICEQNVPYIFQYGCIGEQNVRFVNIYINI